MMTGTGGRLDHETAKRRGERLDHESAKRREKHERASERGSTASWVGCARTVIENAPNLRLSSGCVDEAADAYGFFAEVDEEAEAVITLMKVEQALLDVFGQDAGASLGFEEELRRSVADQEVGTAFGDDDAVVGDRDLRLALEFEPVLRQGEL